MAPGDESGAEESGFASSNGSGDSIRQLEPSLEFPSGGGAAHTGAGPPKPRVHLPPHEHEPPPALSLSARHSNLNSHLSPPPPSRPHSQQVAHQQLHQQHHLNVCVREESAIRSSGPATPLTGWSMLSSSLDARGPRYQREGNL